MARDATRVSNSLATLLANTQAAAPVEAAPPRERFGGFREGRFDQGMQRFQNVSETIGSPFVQDTLRAVFGELPRYGTAERPMLRDEGTSSRVGGWVDPQARHRVYLGDFMPHELASILTHETAHTRQGGVDPGIARLTEQLRPGFEQWRAELLDAVRQGGANIPYPALHAAENEDEYLGYLFQLAMPSVREPRDPAVRAQYESHRRFFPGLQQVRDYIQQRLDAREG